MTMQRLAHRTDFTPEILRLARVDVFAIEHQRASHKIHEAAADAGLTIENMTAEVTVSGVRVPEDSSSHPWTSETSDRVRNDVLARIEEIERWVEADGTRERNDRARVTLTVSAVGSPNPAATLTYEN